MPAPPGTERESPGRPSAAPADDRGVTDRRSVPPRADLTRDGAQEDFLFHLFRGSELLQENRVHDAKEELEFALTMQPLDAKGQDLLGAVYFRLGLYPRAIQIYETLASQFPRDVSVKINLALCCLKTGQAARARRELEEAVRLQPEHRRAWGYLGLALQRLGELEPARAAFERGGHATMAKRLAEGRRVSIAPTAVESAAGSVGAEVRQMAEAAFSELDAGELRFALAEPAKRGPNDGPWHTLELGEAARTQAIAVKTLAPAPLASGHDVVAVPPAGGAEESAPKSVPPLFEFPPDGALAIASGVLVVRIDADADRTFGGRLDALRVAAGAPTTRVLHRKSQGSDTREVLGGIGSPIVRFAGQAMLALGPRPGQRIAVVAVRDGIAFVREDHVLGFDLRLDYDNGRIALEHPEERTRAAAEGVQLVQFRGTGSIAIDVAGKLASVPCTPGPQVLVRREWLVGWLGRIVTRPLPPAEAPGGQRGLIAFSGDGSILVCIE